MVSLAKWKQPSNFRVIPEGRRSQFDENLSAQTLLDSKAYYGAAIKVVHELQHIPDDNYELIVNLWIVRYRALLMLKLNGTAVDELSHLGDLSKYRLEDGTNFIPWEFRVLVACTAYSSLTDKITRLYGLVRECRERAASGDEIWLTRLSDLGVQIGLVLIGAKDYPSAIEHFTRLNNTQSSFWLAVVYFLLGDTYTSREWFARAGVDNDKFACALCSLAEGDYEAAREMLTASEVDSVSTSNNLAIAYLYEGNPQSAISILESLAMDKDSVAALNLTTLYNLREVSPGVASA